MLEVISTKSELCPSFAFKHLVISSQDQVFTLLLQKQTILNKTQQMM